MREEGDSGVDCPALSVYQRHRVGLQHSEHVLHITHRNPVHFQLLGEEGEHDLHRLNDLRVVRSFLPVVHQLLDGLPLVLVVPLEQEDPEQGQGCVHPVLVVQVVRVNGGCG